MSERSVQHRPFDHGVWFVVVLRGDPQLLAQVLRGASSSEFMPRTVEEMALVSALCSFVERAITVCPPA